MNLGLFEDAGYRQLLPLTWLRAAFELRCGVDRLIDKARAHLGRSVARLWLRDTIEEVVTERTDLDEPAADLDWCLLNARAMLTADVEPPPVGVAWQRNGVLIGAGVRADRAEAVSAEVLLNDEAMQTWLETCELRVEHAPESIRLIEHPWELPLANHDELCRQCSSGGVHEGRIHAGAHLLTPGAIHIAAGAVVKSGAVLDAEAGPVHIGPRALIGPNAVIEGPCFIGAKSIVWPGAVIHGNTSIGPVCKVGGEIEASIFQGYSNKQHDGFLGHSYVGEWVNLGAGTITGNLKNTYGTIRVYINGVGVESGQHLVGVIVGDHSKTGIGTILPTGCVIGVAANVFTHRSVPRFVPSFAWLTDAGLTDYRIEKAVHIARTVMLRRDVCLAPAEAELMQRTVELARRIEAAGWE